MERVTAATEAYGAFAYAYDQALGRPFFENLRPHLERVADRHLGGASTHLDLACGTAHLVHWFRQRGLRSCGVDVSLPMLDIARRKSPRPALIAADARMLPLRASFDVITSVYDSLNHFLDREDLLRIFREVRARMHERSTFWFDMNHPSAYTRVWSIEEPFIAEADDYRLAIHTSYIRAEKKATGWVEGWANVGGERVAIDEVHFQRSYSEREIRATLRAARLRVVEMFRFDPFGTEAEPVKLFFVVAAE